MKVYEALRNFGAPPAGMTPADFANDPRRVFQLGMPLYRIDLLQSVDGLDFDDAWRTRVELAVDVEVPVHVISRADLITHKSASGA